MNNRSNHFLLLFFFLCFATTESSAHGVTVCEANGQLFRLYDSNVTVQIDNQISIVTSAQTFENTTGEKNRVRYAFPLTASANPISLRWQIDGGAWEEASVEASEQDDNIPGTSGNNSNNPISQIDHYLGTNAVHFRPTDEIAVGSRITFEIVYVDLLKYSFGKVSFHYPHDYTLLQSAPLFYESFILELKSDRNILDFSSEGPDALLLEVEDNVATYFYDNENHMPDADLNFTYELASDDIGITALSTLTESGSDCDDHAKGFVSMIIEPESNPQAEVIEKNFTLVIDKSGSMNSFDKIDQAKQAASFIVNNLNDGDNFNIISFSAIVDNLFDQHEPYTVANQELALNYIDNLRASGSTNISGSLGEAISQFGVVEPNKANIIIFFTDGVATYGIKDTPELVAEITNQVNTTETGIFLFTFGVGEDVDKRLLTLLATEHSGIVNFLEDNNLEEEITNFFLSINNPVLLDVEISIDPPVISNLFPNPERLPNLYKGEQLIISGRYDEPTDATVTLRGRAYNLDLKYDFPLSLSDSAVVNKSFLPKVWAKQKLDALTLDYYLALDVNEIEAIRDRIDSLSVCYNIVSVQFNSFVDSALEIELLSFDARVIDNEEVELSWSTTMELNNDHFILQRSKDGRMWTDIAKIEGNGTTSSRSDYSFIDKTPYDGISYYRFKQVDLNGEFYFSEVRAVNFKGEVEILVYPNPLPSGHQLNILSGVDEVLTVTILDVTGKTVSEEFLSIGDNSIAVQQLSTGTYFVKITGQDVFKMVKMIVE